MQPGVCVSGFDEAVPTTSPRARMVPPVRANACLVDTVRAAAWVIRAVPAPLGNELAILRQPEHRPARSSPRSGGVFRFRNTAMNIHEFKAWFEGYAEAVNDKPTAEQWQYIKDKIAAIPSAMEMVKAMAANAKPAAPSK